MDPVAISLLVSVIVFAGGVGGLYVHRVVPEHNLSKETQEVVRLGMGMMSVLASLVLGLLIATAKSSYDTTDRQLRSYAAEMILLNETLRDFGEGAAAPRHMLRSFTEQTIAANWDRNRPPDLDNRMAQTTLEHVRELIRALRPVDAGQKSLQDQALDISTSLLRQRWLLIEEYGPTVQPVVMIVLVSWIFVIFASFGLNAPRNAVVLAALLLCAFAIGGSVFLILEMDHPLQGLLKVSSQPMISALSHMN